MKIRSHFTFCHGTRQRYWKYVTLPRISYAFPADTRSSIMFQIVGLAAQRPLRFHDLIKDTHNHTVLVPTSVMQATMSNPTFSPVESLLQLHSLMFIVWIRQFFVKYGMWSESTAVRSRGRSATWLRCGVVGSVDRSLAPGFFATRELHRFDCSGFCAPFQIKRSNCLF